MAININGMAHVVLTVSDFPKARAFYARLLPAFGMKPVFDGPNTTVLELPHKLANFKSLE